MNAAEIKLELFRKLDGLKGNALEEAYGMVINLINSKKEISDWDGLTKTQQEAIQEGINQLDQGQGRSHKQVMSSLKKKYLDA